MRKNRLFILGIFTVMVALVSLTLVSNTWARYTSTVSGDDTARVAKWEVSYTEDGDETKGASSEQTIDFDLFNTLIDESNVATTNGDIIAPGTHGSFSFTLKNVSEVNATYAIDYTITETEDIPVQFRVKLDSGSFSAWADSLDDVAATAIAMTNGQAVYTIEWQWVIDGDNAVDTALGVVGTDTIKVEAKVTFTQVD